MTYRERMEIKLRNAFDPIELLIRDDSAKHAGHSGAHPDGESHFHVAIRAEAFRGQTRVARQRAVMNALAEELSEHVHALSLDVDAPSGG